MLQLGTLLLQSIPLPVALLQLLLSLLDITTGKALAKALAMTVCTATMHKVLLQVVLSTAAQPPAQVIHVQSNKGENLSYHSSLMLRLLLSPPRKRQILILGRPRNWVFIPITLAPQDDGM